MYTSLRWTHKHEAAPTNTLTLLQQKEIGTENSFEFCYIDITKVVST